MDYVHSTPGQHREYLTARLANMEVEHNGLNLLLQQGQEKYRPLVEELEANIATFRKALEELA